jgi:superfamily II DNA/RNA helicase
MFSATFPKAVEELARKILKKPLEIVVGNRSTVSDTVNQIIEVRGEETKFRRLLEIVKEWYDRGNILIFVDRQDAADQLFRQLTTAGYACRPLHGGMDQFDRDTTVRYALSPCGSSTGTYLLCSAARLQGTQHFAAHRHIGGRSRPGRERLGSRPELQCAVPP